MKISDADCTDGWERFHNESAAYAFNIINAQSPAHERQSPMIAIVWLQKGNCRIMQDPHDAEKICGHIMLDSPSQETFDGISEAKAWCDKKMSDGIYPESSLNISATGFAAFQGIAIFAFDGLFKI